MQPKIVIGCLHIMEVIVAFVTVPPDSLPQFVAVLCRTVNGKDYCETSWKVSSIYYINTPCIYLNLIF